MSIKFQCHVCGKTHSVNNRLAGRRAKCTCGTNMTIPSSSAPPNDGEIVTDIELTEADVAPPAPPPQGYSSPQYPWLNSPPAPAQAAWNPAPATPGYPAPGYPAAAAPGSWSAPQPMGFPAASPLSHSPSRSQDDGAVLGLRFVVATVAIVHALYFLLECRHLPTMVKACREFGSAALGFHVFLQICFAIACVVLLGVGIAVLARARPAAQIGFIASLTLIGIGLLQVLVATPWAGPFSVFGSLDLFVAFLFRGVLMRLGPPAFIAWWCYAFGKSR